MKFLLFSLFLYSCAANSTSISYLLRDVVIHDPSVMEARAEFDSARSRMEQARSEHWPVVAATGSKLL